MISASNSLQAGAAVTEFSVTITPSLLSGSVPNGTYTTQTVTAVEDGGTGPYTYEWTTDSGILTINNPDSASTSFTLSGVNRERVETATLKVTDASATPKIAYRSITLFFQFGERL